MKYLATAAALAALATGVVAPAAASAADTFTFKSTADSQVNAASTAPGGPTVMGGTAKVTSKAANADGTTTETHGTCASWSPPPGTAFTSTGVCSLNDAKGELFTVQFTCAADTAKEGEANCWALLVGVGGAYKGRTGTAAYRSSATESHGVGMWN